MIINKIDQKRYIGSSYNVSRRLNEHFCDLRKNQHFNSYLQNAFNKYGEKVFEKIILEYCEPNNKLILEQKYLDTFKPEYNIATSASAPMQGKSHSEAFKIRLKLIHTGNKYCLGKKWSEETRKIQKLSRTGLKRTEYFKEKQRANANRLNLHKYLLPFIESQKKKIIDSDSNIFNSLGECSKFHNISTQTVCDILKGRHFKTRKGVSFKYL